MKKKNARVAQEKKLELWGFLKNILAQDLDLSQL